MFVDPNKVATETGHTHSTIRWKKGSIDSMIGIVYIITLEDSSYNDFTIGGNGGSEMGFVTLWKFWFYESVKRVKMIGYFWR